MAGRAPIALNSREDNEMRSTAGNGQGDTGVGD
jgi:hypothetical protein